MFSLTSVVVHFQAFKEQTHEFFFLHGKWHR